MNTGKTDPVILTLFVSLGLFITPAMGGLIDKTKAPNAANEGISKSLKDEIGVGRGDITTPKSSLFIIKRDPFRAIRRGRQLFQRKFTRAEGQGPGIGDGTGDIHTQIEIGAGLSDNCAGCHARPRGSAGFGGDVVTRPDSRDAIHLFGAGLADVETVYDPGNGVFNDLFATAIPLFDTKDDGKNLPPLKLPKMNAFLVENIFTDFKRHDLGPNFYERNYDGTVTKSFLTSALWGVGSTSPYGHDGRSINLAEVILRHGGEAQTSRDAYVILEKEDQVALFEFLNSLILFPPDDTASNLDPGDRNTKGFPQLGHGSIKLSVLFNDPQDPE